MAATSQITSHEMAERPTRVLILTSFDLDEYVNAGKSERAPSQVVFAVVGGLGGGDRGAVPFGPVGERQQ